jgi:uncharacterized protein
VGRLRDIERAEAFIRDLGISQVRVRHHGSIARIEVEERDLLLVLEERNRIAEELADIGFTFVALDLRGYRTGSMNEGQ